MRPIDADELIERVWKSSIRTKRSTTELIRESKTIDLSKIEKDKKDLKEGWLTMKKRIVGILLALALVLGAIGMTGCASLDRMATDIKSEVGNGLNRTITVYTANGEIIAQYKGKIDIQESDGGYVKFDYDGKRYIYYNCFVETIADK